MVFRFPGGREERLVTTLENDAEHFSLVASTAMGQTLYTFQLRESNAVLDVRVPLPRAFDPRLLPALIQFADWPLENVRKGLDAETSFQELDRVRTLSRRGQTVLTLTREGSGPPYRILSVAIPAASIQIVLTTLEEQP